MHIKSSLSTIVISATLFVAGPVLAQHDHQPAAKSPGAPAAGKLIPVTEKDAAWAAKARKDYPLEVCVASDEKLGSMGKSPEYIYRVAGQPDRLVILCCDGCEEDFAKDSAKYLAKIDAAKGGKAPGAGTGDKKRKHE